MKLYLVMQFLSIIGSHVCSDSFAYDKFVFSPINRKKMFKVISFDSLFDRVLLLFRLFTMEEEGGGDEGVLSDTISSSVLEVSLLASI
jgi:hypothetical protein